MYITAAATISHQPTFRNAGFSRVISTLADPSNILHPDYQDHIPAQYRRRMSDVLKMSITCTMDCLRQTGIAQPDAIVVGTSMGCNTFTKQFLDKITASKGGLISPTAFIVSTHNTIAGQISLMLGNHNYNMTHTQNSLSFEHALTDAMLCLKEGKEDVLVGAADEMENALFNMHERLGDAGLQLACGASFFMLSSKPVEVKSIKLQAVTNIGLNTGSKKLSILKFLEGNNLDPNDIDLVLYAQSKDCIFADLRSAFGATELLDYQALSGVFFTNSAFAMHYGLDLLQSQTAASPDGMVSRIFICNNLVPENLGLILIEIE